MKKKRTSTWHWLPSLWLKSINVFKIVTNWSTYLLPPCVALTAQVTEFLQEGENCLKAHLISPLNKKWHSSLQSIQMHMWFQNKYLSNLQKWKQSLNTAIFFILLKPPYQEVVHITMHQVTNSQTFYNNHQENKAKENLQYKLLEDWSSTTSSLVFPCELNLACLVNSQRKLHLYWSKCYGIKCIHENILGYLHRVSYSWIFNWSVYTTVLIKV